MRAILIALAAALVTFAMPAMAQDAQWSLCLNGYGEFEREAQIDACDTIIASEEFEGVRLAIAYASRARARSELGDFRRAVVDYREAVRLAPGNPSLLNGLCWNMALANDNLDEARAICDESLRIRPNDDNTLDSRGMVGLKQGRFQQAWADYDAAFQRNGIAPFLYGRGIAAKRLGRTTEGDADIAAALEMDPGIAETYARRGMTP